MEDYRHRLVVIVAGYPRLMHRSSARTRACARASRARSRSRITRPELLEIAEEFAARNGYVIAPTRATSCARVFDVAERNEGFGNARFARTLFEQALNTQALRLTGQELTARP